MTRYRIAALLLLAPMAGCDPQDCSLGYDAGEKFRVTVNGLRHEGDVPCAAAAPNSGDSLTLTADNSLRQVAGTNQCYSRPATNEIPAFLREVMTECEPGSGQLGVECRGVLSDGCGVGFTMFVGPRIGKDVAVIEDGYVTINWRSVQEQCSLLSWSCAATQYSVRIERLPRQETSN